MKIQVFVLEYSPTQKSFHIESLTDMLDDNLLGFHSGKLTDYLPLVVSSDRKKLDKIANKLKDMRDRRRDNQGNKIQRS